MTRVQDGRASCLYAARLIEDMHNAAVDEAEKVGARLGDCAERSEIRRHGKLVQQFSERSLQLEKARASLGAIHYHVQRKGVDQPILDSIRDECEYIVPELKALRPNADPV